MDPALEPKHQQETDAADVGPANAMGLEWEWALEISGVQTTYSIVQQIFFCPSVKRIRRSGPLSAASLCAASLTYALRRLALRRLALRRLALFHV